VSLRLDSNDSANLVRIRYPLVVIHVSPFRSLDMTPVKMCPAALTRPGSQVRALLRPPLKSIRRSAHRPSAWRESRCLEGLIASAYCSSPAARAASQRAALAIAAGPVGGNVRLEIAENRPPRVLKLQARDFVGACCAYYVGIFISAQDRDTVVEVNKRDTMSTPAHSAPARQTTSGQ